MLLLCNPENRRAHYFMEAAQTTGVAVDIVSWSDFLHGRTLPESEDIRIESPGENVEVEERLIRLGAEVLHRPTPDFDPTPGRIQSLDLWFAGFAEALGQLPPMHFMNAPSAILSMTDKLESHQKLKDSPRPRFLGSVRTAADWMTLVNDGFRRTFLKPRYGSSASGVLACLSDGKRHQIKTSVELEDGKLYNSLKVRTYTDSSEIAWIIDTLGASGLIAETWVPKSGLGDEVCDFRVVGIDGNSEFHTVLRLSKSPMTNLHLGNRRGELELAMERIDPKIWKEMVFEVQKIMTSFGAFYAGFDIAFSPSWKEFWILEVNAFGDLIPGVEINGANTYFTEIQSWLERNSGSS